MRVGRDLACVLEGGWPVQVHRDHNMESGLVAEDVPGSLPGLLHGANPHELHEHLTWQPTAPSLQCVCILTMCS